MTQQTPSAGRGWLVVSAALGINLVLGALYAWSVIGAALRQSRGWSQTDANLPFAVATAVFAVTMIFAGRVQDKLGPRNITILGGLLLGGAMIISAFTTSPLLMCLTFGVIGGMGIGLGYAATTPASMKWFSPARKGLITGIVVSGIALASVYMAPLTRYLLTFLTLPQTLISLGIGTLVVVPSLAFLLINPPAGYIPPQPAKTSARAKAAGITRPDRDWNHVLTTPQFWLLWITFVLAATPGLMMLVNAMNISNLLHGVTAKTPAELALVNKAILVAAKSVGVTAVITLGVFNMVGRLLSGYVSDRLGRTNTMILAFLLQSVNMFLFSYYKTDSMFIFGAAYTGLCYGAIFTLMPAAMADFFGVKNLGVNYGLLFTAFGVAGATGSLLGGKVADLLGSYDKAYMIVAIMLVVAAVLAFTTRAPEVVAEKTQADRVPEPAKV